MTTMKNIVIIITILLVSSACTKREDISAWVCNCQESDSLRVDRFENGDLPDYDFTESIQTFCADSIVEISSNWPNRIEKLETALPDCYRIFNNEFQLLD